MTDLDHKYGKILSPFWWIHDVMCIKRVRRTNINLTDFVMILAPYDDLSLINAEWMRAWSYTISTIYHYQKCACLGKQCRPRWNAAFWGVSTWSTLIVYHPFFNTLSLFLKCVLWILS